MNQTYNRNQIADYATQAGFTGILRDIMVAIAYAESRFQSDPPGNPTHYGILQFDTVTAGDVGYTVQDVKTPLGAFKAAKALMNKYGVQSALGHWETYTNNSYKNYMPGMGTNLDPGKLAQQFGYSAAGAIPGGQAGADFLGQVGNSMGGVSSIVQAPQNIATSVANIPQGIMAALFAVGRGALPYIILIVGILLVGGMILVELTKQ